MIVYYYGGTFPTTRTFGGRYPKNLYAARGYIVYVIQPSGAVGYGQEFSAAHVNNWGISVADEIIDGTKKMIEILNLKRGDDRFIKPIDEHLKRNFTNIPGIFIAGASGGPKCIAETITDAQAAAIEIAAYLRKKIQHD